MKFIKVFFILLLSLSILIGFSAGTQARMMMMANVSTFTFDAMPTALFTMDNWLSTPNLWYITITSDKQLDDLRLKIHISSDEFDPIASGWLILVGLTAPHHPPHPAGAPILINNMDAVEGGHYPAVNWTTEGDFLDEVISTGNLPEGTYYLKFYLKGRYTGEVESFDGTEDDENGTLFVEQEIEIKNPLPPELMTPDDASDDVVSVPRFTWQKPAVSVLPTPIEIFYTINLWKMFEDDGTILNEEDAIVRIPIWVVEGISSAISNEAVDFDPNTSREELISGRKYCWQIQAFDGLGHFISPTNDGKSDVWEFTVQFSPPSLNDPQTFFPMTITWSPAQTAGGQVFYRIRVDDNPDFSNPYEQEGIVMTSFTYPDDAPALQHGINYYVEVQTTDDANIPLGEPDQITFSLPPVEVELRTPADETVLPSNTPGFEWSGNSEYYVVNVFDETSDWTFSSTPVQGTSWIYDGEDLSPGVSYSWNVTPTNQFSDQIGDSSETWSITLPAADQITLVSPVNENIDTVFPIFVWNEFSVAAGDQVNYNLVVMDGDENIIHSVVVTGTQYQYPQDAEALKYASRYIWYVGAESGGAEIAVPSTPAGFVTPFVTVEGEEVSMDEIGDAVKIVMSDYPEFAEFEGKVLLSISDETGPITPDQLMDIIGKFKIVKVSIE